MIGSSIRRVSIFHVIWWMHYGTQTKISAIRTELLHARRKDKGV